MGGDSFSDGSFGDPKHRVSGPGVTRTLYSSGIGAFAGTFYGACLLAWYPDPVVTAGRTGGLSGRTDFRAVGRMILRPAMWFSLTAGVFTGVECLMEAARNEVQDPWNSLVAGLAGGAVIGATTGSPQIMGATAIGTGLFMAAMDMTGPTTVMYEDLLKAKRLGLMPKQFKESDDLAALKEKFPQHKDL